MTIYLVPGLLALSITMFFAGLARWLSMQGDQIDTRLERFGTREEYTFMSGDEHIAVFGENQEVEEKRGGFLTRWLERRASRDETGTNAMRDELARADLKLKVAEWQMFQMISVLLMLLVGYLVFRNWVLAPLMGIVGFFLPRFYLRYRQGQRLKAFNNMLSDAIVMLSNSLRAGYSFLQSMEVLSQEMPEPIASEFGRVVREVGLGLTQQQALANLYRRIQSGDLDMMITAVNVQQEVGGNLAEILDTLAHTIRERVRIQGEIRVLVSQQMLSGYVITFLPVALAIFLFLYNREYISRLYQEPCGWIMLGTTVLMMIAGFFTIQKIVNIEV